METRQYLTEKLTGYDPALRAEDILLPLPSCLPRETSGDTFRHADNVAALTTDALILYEEGKLAEKVPREALEKFTFRVGIGCVFAEYTLKSGESAVLCRADMRYSDYYAAVLKQMNRAIKGQTISYAYEAELERVCPKCGRPYPPGATFCDHCAPKRNYIARLWALAKPYHKMIYLSVALYFLHSVIKLVPPYLNKVLVDDYIKAAETPLLSQFLLVILSIFLVNLLMRVIHIGRSLTLIEAGNDIIVRLREMVFAKIQTMSIARISKRTAGQLMNRVSDDTNVVRDFLTNDMGNVLEQLITFLAISTYLFVYDWKLALLILAPAPLVMWLNRLLHQTLHRRYHRQWTLSERSNTVLHDIFSGIRVVKAFGMEKNEEKRYDAMIAEERNTQFRNEAFFARTFPFLGFLMGIGEFFLLYYVGNKILGGQMTIGEMSQFSAYVSIVYGPLRWMANIPRRLVRIMTSIVRIYDIVDDTSDVSDKEDSVDLDIKGHIEIDNVSFGYDNSNEVLHNVSLDIRPGDFIGIVGKSGAGKTTLTNLVMRLYDVDEGEIRIDGVDIRDISQRSLRSQIGVVLQETFLFSGTVYDNICYAKPDASRDEVLNAAKLAGAHNFIMKLPDAYNTIVGEKGYTLSGGERQRVAIARALLHDPRILILDEATSSLDTETEKQIQDALQKLTKDRTTLAIAHRLSTLRNATRILVLDKNTVAETGTHEELMRRKGIYYGLVMAQRQMSRMKATDKTEKNETREIPEVQTV